MTLDDGGRGFNPKGKRLTRDSLNRLLAPWIASTDRLHLAYMTSNRSMNQHDLLQIPAGETSIVTVADPVTSNRPILYLSHTHVGSWRHISRTIFAALSGEPEDQDLVGETLYFKQGSDWAEEDLDLLQRLADYTRKELVWV